MATKSPDTRRFDRLSKQRIDYTDLPGGGSRARMTITLPNGKSYTFVEDVTPTDISTYEAQIAGAEIGYAIQEVGWNGVDEVGSFFGGLVKAVGKGLKTVAKGAVKVVGGVAKLAKKVVTSKIMQTAAKGLAFAAPFLGPLAPAALGVSAGIGIAGKILGAKTASEVGADRTATAMTESAVQDAQILSPQAYPSLLTIAGDKARAAQELTGGPFGARNVNPGNAAYGAIMASAQQQQQQQQQQELQAQQQMLYMQPQYAQYAQQPQPQQYFAPQYAPQYYVPQQQQPQYYTPQNYGGFA